MYGSYQKCNVSRTTDQEQKLQKIKELTNILKVSFIEND